eukprot:5766410-Pleurochrysis_carterae.AAC.2
MRGADARSSTRAPCTAKLGCGAANLPARAAGNACRPWPGRACDLLVDGRQAALAALGRAIAAEVRLRNYTLAMLNEDDIATMHHPKP